MTPRKANPETLVQKAIVEYLRACKIGKVKRVNTGCLFVGGSNHPWGPKGRPVRFGENGHSDLQVELAMDQERVPLALRGRDLFLEVKTPGWNPPSHPRPGSAKSTWDRWRHHQDQAAFIARQQARGNAGGFVRSPLEVYQLLTALGFQGLPVPA